MRHLKREIKVELLDKARDYYFQLNQKIQEKFLKCFDKTEAGIKGSWFEKLKTKHGIFEFRVRDNEKFYRIFAFWDNEFKPKTLILCTHGFYKKSNKTPKSEIERAARIKEQYLKIKNKK